MKEIQIAPGISYLPSTENPFTCDVVFIKTNKATWVFDVGMDPAQAEYINSVEGPKKVVLSHFHSDHITNLDKVNYDELYVGTFTKKYTEKGTVVKEPLTFDEEPQIQIVEIPSSHSKSSLCIKCGDYLFSGDSTYCRDKNLHHFYNAQLLKEEIDFIEKLDCKYVTLSHSPNFVQNKDDLVKLLKDLYSRYKPGNPVISVDDFFNPDGSVKPEFK